MVLNFIRLLLHLATQESHRVESMVLVSATTHFPEQTRKIMRQYSMNTLSEEQLSLLRQKHKRGDSQIRMLFQQGQEFANSEDMNFTSQHLSKISANTLIVQGDRDFLYPVEISVEMYKAIPNAALWIIPNAIKA